MPPPHPHSRSLGPARLGTSLGLVLLALGCQGDSAARRELASIERLFDSARYVRDQLNAARELAAPVSPHGVPVALLDSVGRSLWRHVGERADSLPETALDSADRAALVRIRERVELIQWDSETPAATPAACPVRSWSDDEFLDAFADRVLACYALAADLIVVDGDTLDRQTILTLLSTTPSPARRERLFRALDGVWRSVDGDGRPGGSPYRELVRRRRLAWRTDDSPFDRRPSRLGIEPGEAERWMVAGLEAWRRLLPDTLVEPWSHHYAAGAASRALESRIPKDSLLPVTRRYFAALGARPDSLGVRYDLEPRLGGTAGAFAEFGARSLPWGPGWERSEPLVFGSYRTGGLANLVELLHETGHAVHIAAIDTRPAFHDWPDSDLFTETVADLASFEAYEPGWQLAYLGDSVPLHTALRDKYASIMFDMAWALFDLRVHRDGAAAPNEVWTEIATRYLGIRPHPELSWWAMRMQLVVWPGYMMNYALGAFVVAQLRAEIERRIGPITVQNEAWYRETSAGLFRHGAEVPSRLVLHRFLGGPPTPDALLADLARIAER